MSRDYQARMDEERTITALIDVNLQTLMTALQSENLNVLPQITHVAEQVILQSRRKREVVAERQDINESLRHIAAEADAAIMTIAQQ